MEKTPTRRSTMAFEFSNMPPNNWCGVIYFSDDEDSVEDLYHRIHPSVIQCKDITYIFHTHPSPTHNSAKLDLLNYRELVDLQKNVKDDLSTFEKINSQKLKGAIRADRKFLKAIDKKIASLKKP